MSDLNDIAHKVLNWANDDEQVEVYVSRGVDTEIVVYESNIESLSRAEALGAGVRVIKDGRQGFSYAGTLDESILRETFLEARDNANFATYDEFVGLVEPDGVNAVELDLWNPGALDFGTDRKVDLAMELEKQVRAGDTRIRNVQTAEYGDGAVEAAVVSTAGIDAAYRRSGCYVSASAIAGEGDETQTGGGYSIGRTPQDLDVTKASNDAVIRATRLLGATRPKSDVVTAVFDNRLAPMFIGALASSLNGENVLKGRSFLADKMNEFIAITNFTLVDDPTNPLAYTASPFDGEGLATRRNVLIENGALQSFLYDGYAARRTGRASNGCAIRGGYASGPSAGARALSLEPGELSQQEIIKKIDNGVLIQSVLGASTGGINPVSGDISLGAEGFLIRSGAVDSPIREFTIAANLQQMLLDIAYIGNDIEWLPGSCAGVSIAISQMSLGGT